MTEAKWFSCNTPDRLLDFVCDIRRRALGITYANINDESQEPSRIYPRKRRLFATACCRRMWGFLPDAARHAVEAAERFADGEISDADRMAAMAQVEAAGNEYVNRRTVSDEARQGSWHEWHALKAAGGALRAFTDSRHSTISLWVGPGKRPFLDSDDDDGGFTNFAYEALNTWVRATDDPDGAPILDALRFRYLHPEVLALEGYPVAGTGWYAEVIVQCALLHDLFGNPFRPSLLDPGWLQRNDGAVAAIARSIYAERTFEYLPILADALLDAGCHD